MAAVCHNDDRLCLSCTVAGGGAQEHLLALSQSIGTVGGKISVLGSPMHPRPEASARGVERSH